jgi:tetratricopeptide (TPR) repeat protein
MKKLVVALALAAGLSGLACGRAENAMKSLRLQSQAQSAYEAGDFQKATDLLTDAATFAPEEPEIYINRGNAFSELGKLGAALSDYDTAILKATPVWTGKHARQFADIYYNRGYAYEHAGLVAKAIPDYEQTIVADADYPDVKNNLAWILATSTDPALRDPKRAIELSTRENEKKRWKAPSALDTIAAAYAAAGDFGKAVEMAKKAITLSDDATATTRYRERLALYEKQQAYVDAK